MPKISIIVPIYNTEKYLNRCVDSILDQTFTDFECILVDDGSNDSCPHICDEYAKNDVRIKVIHKINGGQAEAKNMGIDIAVGEYIHCIDSDDWIHPQMLEILYRGIIKNNVLLSVCAYEEVQTYKNFKKIYEPKFEIFDGMDFLIANDVNAVVPWAKLYHKSLFDGIRYPVGRVCEDEFITYRILYKAGKIAFCNEKMYMYFINYEGITKSGFSPKRMKDAYIALEERLIFFKNARMKKMCIYTVNILFCITYRNYNQLKDSNKYCEYSKFLRNKMRKYLLMYSRKVNINVKSHAHYYEIAFPKFMRMYWLIDIFKRKTASEGLVLTIKKGLRNLKNRI